LCLQEDYNVCVREKIVDNTDIPCPVDDTGRFMAPVTDFLGMYIKDADKVRDSKQGSREDNTSFLLF
jgi:isoleucyl-tRNA synthetase